MRSYRKRRYTRRRRPLRGKRSYRKRRFSRRRRTSTRRRYSKPILIWRRIGAEGYQMPTTTYHWGTVPVTPLVKLDQCSDKDSLKNMWTYYKIVKAKAVWTVPSTPDRTGPATDVNGAIPNTQVTNGINWPVIGHYIDYDAQIDVANMTMLMEEKTAVLSPLKPGVHITRTWTPKYLTNTYVGPVTNGYVPKTGWVTMSHSNLPHYGLVWDLDYQDLKNINGMPYTCTYWIQVALRGLDSGKFQKRYNLLRN